MRLSLINMLRIFLIVLSITTCKFPSLTGDDADRATVTLIEEGFESGIPSN